MLQIQHIAKRYGDQVVLEDIQLTVPNHAKLAIFGLNGSGKSTLLRILCGQETADSGNILKSQNLNLVYLPQEPNPQPERTVLEEVQAGHGKLTQITKDMAGIEEKLHSASEADPPDPKLLDRLEHLHSQYQILGGAKLQASAEKTLTGLGFSRSDFERSPTEFSGGDRMRIELAKVLIAEADILVLDEPTNHLDIRGYMFIERMLKEYDGTLLLVTHDRHLLDHLPSHILFLEHGKCRLFKGNLTDTENKLAEEEEQAAQHNERLQRKIKDMERLVDRFRAKASKAGLVRSRMKMLLKLYEQKSDEPGQDSNRSLSSAVLQPLPSGQVVMKIHDLQAGYTKPIVSVPDLKIEKQMRLGIVGVNGAGKSTVLKTMAGLLPALTGTIQLGHQVSMSYMEQDVSRSFQPKLSLLENFLGRCPEYSEKNARQLLGRFLFSGNDVYKPTEVLSGGEKARLALACLFGSRANLLLLDEPTNHLDLQSKDALLAMCLEYTGTMALVSHDREFMNQLATHILAINGEGKSTLVHGSFDELAAYDRATGFLQWTEATVQTLPQKPSAAPTANVDRRTLGKDMAKLQKKLQSIEKEVADLNGSITILESRMAHPTSAGNFQQLAADDKQAQELRLEVAAKENLWLEVQEQLEDLQALLETPPS
jgi:ATP-binding cassette subfamily F protein 3